MNHKTHSYLMVGLLAVGAGLYLSGGVGGGALLLWPLLCMGMTFGMMRSMGGMSRGPAEHTHANGVTHTHDDGATHSHDEVPGRIA